MTSTLTLKIISGVLIPAFAAIMFNMLQLVVDAHETGKVGPVV